MTRYQKLHCSRCGEWTMHQYPRAPKTHFPIRCCKCGDGWEIETCHTAVEIRNGQRRRVRLVPEFHGLLEVN